MDLTLSQKATVTSRLEFITRFAEMTVARLDGREFGVLKSKLSTFLGEGSAHEIFEASSDRGRLKPKKLLALLRAGAENGLLVDLPDGKFATELTREDLSNLQQIAGTMLGAWADWQDAAEGKWQGNAPPTVFEFSLLSARFLPLPTGLVLTTRRIEGSFAFALALLLASPSATEVLRRCPVCASFFIRVRRQKYCNRSCTNRANMREWRRTAKGRASGRERSHRNYKRKQHAKPGLRHAVVQRKARLTKG